MAFHKLQLRDYRDVGFLETAQGDMCHPILHACVTPPWWMTTYHHAPLVGLCLIPQLQLDILAAGDFHRALSPFGRPLAQKGSDK